MLRMSPVAARSGVVEAGCGCFLVGDFSGVPVGGVVVGHLQCGADGDPVVTGFAGLSYHRPLAGGEKFDEAAVGFQGLRWGDLSQCGVFGEVARRWSAAGRGSVSEVASPVRAARSRRRRW